MSCCYKSNIQKEQSINFNTQYQIPSIASKSFQSMSSFHHRSNIYPAGHLLFDKTKVSSSSTSTSRSIIQESVSTDLIHSNSSTLVTGQQDPIQTLYQLSSEDYIEMFLSDDIRNNLRQNRIKEQIMRNYRTTLEESSELVIKDWDNVIRFMGPNSINNAVNQGVSKVQECNQMTFANLKRERCKNFLYTLKNMIKKFITLNILKLTHLSQQAHDALHKYFGTKQKCQLAQLNALFNTTELQPVLAEFFYDGKNQVLFDMQVGRTKLKNKRSFMRNFWNAKRSFVRGKITALTF